MRVNCYSCGKPAVVTKTNRLDNKYTEVYCLCKQHTCGATFVAGVEFKHAINPPVSHVTSLMSELICSMSDEAKKELLAQLNQTA